MSVRKLIKKWEFAPEMKNYMLQINRDMIGRCYYNRNALMLKEKAHLKKRPIFNSDTGFFRGTTRLMSWPDRERYLRPPQSLVVSLLLSLVSTLVFSRTGGVLSHRSILTHRFPQFPPRNLCSLIMLAVSSLVYAATEIAFF